jgi:hypothetical protein
MRQLVSHIPLTACALAAALLVSACGGGDATAPKVDIGSSGFAVDDYISGATVVCDVNGNGVSDAGEATTSTDSTGFFKFNATCASTLVATGGTNIDTQLPFVGKLMAPAGSTMLTPLTTLMAEGMTTEQINAALGLPAGTNVTTLDPARKVGGELENADLFRKTLAVQQVLQKTAETLAALAGSNDVAAMYSQAAAAMVTVLRGGSSLVAGDVMNQSTVSSAVQAAATRVSADVNAASLAQVMAGALAAQASLILSADSAQAITDTTTAQQGSSAIQVFVLANKTAVKAAPGETTASLAGELTSQVSGGGAVTPPPPPATSGTLLLSFDEANPVFIDMGAYGGAQPDVVAGPTGGSGSALKILKPAGQEPWGGVYFGVPSIPFAADRKVITARVYSTRANAVIKFKVEHSQTVATEVASAPVPANTWTTVSWDMTGVDLSKAYSTIAVTPDQDVAASGQTYYIDEITLAAASDAVAQPPVGASCATSTEQCISFSEADAGVNPFEGLISAEVITDPSSVNNKLLKMVKGPSGQPWAGATVYTSIADDGTTTLRTVPTIGLNTSKTVTLRAYSGAAVGTKVTLKLENALGAGSVFAEARTTKQNEWETLTFNFATPSAGSFNANVNYDMATVFPAWSEIAGSQSALGADTAFLFDELKYAVSGATAPPPPPPPATGSSVLATFDETTPLAINEFGGAVAVIAAGPAGGTGNVLKITRNGGEPWAGSWISIPQIPSNAGAQTVSARFYSPTAGIPVSAKVEYDDNAGSGEVRANEVVAAGWQTLTFTFPSLNATKVYNRFVMLPNVGTQDSAKDYFFDDITFTSSGGGSGAPTPPVGGDPTAEMGSGGPQTLPLAVSNDQHAFIAVGDGVFAGDYIGKLDANGNHAGWENASSTGIAKNGNIGYFQDALLSGASSQIVETGGNGWVTGNIDNPGGVGNFFRYFLLRAPAVTFADSYMGLYVNAPNNGTVDVTTYGNIKFKLWGPAEMYQNGNFNPTVQVILTGPKVAGCTATGSGGTEIIKNLVANQKIGAGSNYTISLAGWTVNGVCGTDTNATAVNTVLSKLARVVVSVPGSSFNFTNAAPGDSSLYATGVNLGPIAFVK